MFRISFCYSFQTYHSSSIHHVFVIYSLTIPLILIINRLLNVLVFCSLQDVLIFYVQANTVASIHNCTLGMFNHLSYFTFTLPLHLIPLTSPTSHLISHLTSTHLTSPHLTSYLTSHITHHTSHLTHLTSHITHHTSHLTPHTSHLTPHTSYLIPHTSYLIPHTSYLTPHSSLLTPHTSHLTPHTSHSPHLTPHLTSRHSFSFSLVLNLFYCSYGSICCALPSTSRSKSIQHRHLLYIRPLTISSCTTFRSVLRMKQTIIIIHLV